jgi:ABC-type transporter Mla subunit MlaD
MLLNIKNILLSVCLVVLIVLLITTTIRLNSILNSVDTLIKTLNESFKDIPAVMASLKEASDTSNMVSTETLNLMGTTTTVVDEIKRKIKTFDVNKLNTTVDNVNNNVNDISKSAEKTLNTVNDVMMDVEKQTSSLVENTNTQFDKIGNSTKESLDHLTLFLDEGSNTLRSTQTLMNGPFTKSITDLDSILLKSDLVVNDVQIKTHEWLFPPKQSKLMKTYKFIKSITPLVQPAYYGLRFYNESN